jgi:hypothetical protein
MNHRFHLWFIVQIHPLEIPAQEARHNDSKSLMQTSNKKQGFKNEEQRLISILNFLFLAPCSLFIFFRT